MNHRPGVGVSVLVFRDPSAQDVLLVQRGKAPAKGMWSPPGGGVELGETVAEAAAREVLEETGLHVEVPEDATFTSVDVIEREDDGTIRFHYVLIEVVALCEDDTVPVAADDAVDCRWWPISGLHEAQPQVPDLVRVVKLARERVRLAIGEQKTGV
ncbi:MAG: NUDIX hydrolase [Chloroflexota bacterium]|nr:NUDIX hydrolase [Chloroflexota bacterium]